MPSQHRVRWAAALFALSAGFVARLVIARPATATSRNNRTCFGVRCVRGMGMTCVGDDENICYTCRCAVCEE